MGTEPTGKFNTHENYLRAFAQLAGFDYLSTPDPVLAALADDIRATRAFARARPSASPDINQVRKSLANAWGMELLLGVSGEIATDAELLGLVNAQGVVQAYYAVYHAAQALSVARGGRRVESHPATQKQFASLWMTPTFGVAPWCLASTKDGYSGLPSGHSVDETVHSWTSCTPDTCLDIACKALRTTREGQFKDAIKKAREQKRKKLREAWKAEEEARVRGGRRPRKEPSFSLPRLDPLERRSAEAGVRAHTLIDYLYRLRINAQYVDPSTFTEGAEMEYESQGVHRDLQRLVASTLLVHEIFIAAAISGPAMTKIVSDWMAARQPSGVGHIGFARRRDLVLPSVSDVSGGF